jgi:hypothetical protein
VADGAIVGTAFKLGARFRRPSTEHACVCWSQPYGGGLLGKSWQPNKVVVLAKADAGGGKLQARPEMPRTEPTGPCHLGD